MDKGVRKKTFGFCLRLSVISCDMYFSLDVIEWFNEYKLQEGEFKFYDYFASQNRKIVKITKVDDFDENMLYRLGNTIDLEKLIKSFPFN